MDLAEQYVSTRLSDGRIKPCGDISHGSIPLIDEDQPEYSLGHGRIQVGLTRVQTVYLENIIGGSECFLGKVAQDFSFSRFFFHRPAPSFPLDTIRWIKIFFFIFAHFLHSHVNQRSLTVQR